MLEIKNLYAGYGKENVLENISIKVKKNTITAVVGKNGCGKSTLASCIASQMKYKGSILLEGEDILKMNAALRAKKIALLPQRLTAPAILIKDLVMFGRNPYMGLFNKPSEEDFIKVKNAIETAGIKGLEAKYASSVSGGELQRAYIAMILAQDTDLIILDEPTTYMDISFSGELFGILKKINKTILVIMHDLSCAVRYADEIAVIDNKKIAFSGKAYKCIESGVLEEIFKVKMHSFEERGKRFTIFE